jgi:hypothetical protein
MSIEAWKGYYAKYFAIRDKEISSFDWLLKTFVHFLKKILEFLAIP